MKLKRSRLAKVAVLTLLVAPGLGALYWCYHFPIDPEGLYYDPFVGSIEPPYWVFRNGRVWMQEKGARDVGSGVYVKSNGAWILLGNSNEPDIVLKPSPFGIRMISKDSSGWSIYLPRRGYSWLKPADSSPLNQGRWQTNKPTR